MLQNLEYDDGTKRKLNKTLTSTILPNEATLVEVPFLATPPTIRIKSYFNANEAIKNGKISMIIQQHTREIHSLMRRTTQKITKIGQKLTDVKAQLGHGNFGV